MAKLTSSQRNMHETASTRVGFNNERKTWTDNRSLPVSEECEN